MPQQFVWLIVGIAIGWIAKSVLSKNAAGDFTKPQAAKPPPVAGADIDPQILELAKTSKIDAIKRYREMYGTDLKTAKDAVESITSNDGHRG